MSYVIQITNEHGHNLGYIRAARTIANMKAGFRTYDGRKAQRFASKDKAHDRAGRFNSMRSHEGFKATVVPLTQEIEDAR